MLALVGLKPTDFNPKVWAAQKLNGKNWIVPLDTHPFVMFYNADVCQKAGLLDADGKLETDPGRREEFEAALAAVQKVTGAVWRQLGQRWRLRHALAAVPDAVLAADGATPFISGGGTKLTVNEDLATKTLAYIQKLSKTNLLAPTADYAGAQTLMFTGKAGVLLRGTVGDHHRAGIQGLKFGIVPDPAAVRQGRRRKPTRTRSCCLEWSERRNRWPGRWAS